MSVSRTAARMFEDPWVIFARQNSSHADGTTAHARQPVYRDREDDSITSSHADGTAAHGAIDWTVLSKEQTPSSSERREIWRRVLADLPPEETYEHRNGAVRYRLDWGPSKHWQLQAFGECGDTLCGCCRMAEGRIRQRYSQWVVERAGAALRSTASGTPRPVRLVTLGAGALLTDFEILLGLWMRGHQIESIVAIDVAYPPAVAVPSRPAGLLQASCSTYAGGSSDGHAAALSAAATFFAPARVFSFNSTDDYTAAVESSGELYGHANLLLFCDAAAVRTKRPSYDTWVGFMGEAKQSRARGPEAPKPARAPPRARLRVHVCVHLRLLLADPARGGGRRRCPLRCSPPWPSQRWCRAPRPLSYPTRAQRMIVYRP